MKKTANSIQPTAIQDFAAKVTGTYATVLADPPWRFQNRTGKMAPEHQRLLRYPTLTLEEIRAIPVGRVLAPTAHLYLWVPNALLAEGLEVMRGWGFTYKTNLVWYKVRKDGGPDGRGVGFYFRNVTELVLFGIRGPMRTLQPGRTQTNIMISQKREHSRKPDHNLQHRRDMLSWTLSGIVRPFSPARLGSVGQRGRRGKFAERRRPQKGACRTLDGPANPPARSAAAIPGTILTRLRSSTPTRPQKRGSLARSPSDLQAKERSIRRNHPCSFPAS